jgi:hypothetical protein
LRKGAAVRRDVALWVRALMVRAAEDKGQASGAVGAGVRAMAAWDEGQAGGAVGAALAAWDESAWLAWCRTSAEW